MNNLGILQSLPNAPRNPVRTDSFSKFQAICGYIEREDYLAAHAACHATMNGIERTTAVHADMTSAESIFGALSRILADETAAGIIRALVIPGLTDFALQTAICDRCREAASQRPFDIFFDPPEAAGLSEILSHQKTLPRFASLCMPYVATVTPGRRSADLLPPSCLIAPLALSAATHLRGVHDMPGLSRDDAATLARCGVRVMMPKTADRRRVLALFYADQSDAPASTAKTQPRGNIVRSDDAAQAISDEEIRFEAELAQTLQMQCAECLRAHPANNRDLWAALSRAATSALMHAKSRGQITGYRVRCDEETASRGNPDCPAVEIVIQYPKRVRSVTLNIGSDPRR